MCHVSSGISSAAPGRACPPQSVQQLTKPCGTALLQYAPWRLTCPSGMALPRAQCIVHALAQSLCIGCLTQGSGNQMDMRRAAALRQCRLTPPQASEVYCCAAFNGCNTAQHRNPLALSDEVPIVTGVECSYLALCGSLIVQQVECKYAVAACPLSTSLAGSLQNKQATAGGELFRARKAHAEQVHQAPKTGRVGR